MATAVPSPSSAFAYQRHRPETTALYEVVRDNLETLHGRGHKLGRVASPTPPPSAPCDPVD